MAGITLGVDTASTANAAPYVSGSFTPAQGDLLVVFSAASATNVAAPTMVASANGITFTLLFAQLAATSNHRRWCWVADQRVGSGPASMTVTLSGMTSDEATGCILEAFSVTGLTRAGIAAGGAVRQFKATDNNHATGGVNPTITLDAAPLTTNPIVTLLGNNGPAGAGAPTSWTLLTESAYLTPGHAAAVCYIASGHTNATITHTATSSVGSIAAVEFDATPIPPIIVMPPRRT